MVATACNHRRKSDSEDCTSHSPGQQTTCCGKDPPMKTWPPFYRTLFEKTRWIERERSRRTCFSVGGERPPYPTGLYRFSFRFPTSFDDRSSDGCVTVCLAILFYIHVLNTGLHSTANMNDQTFGTDVYKLIKNTAGPELFQSLFLCAFPVLFTRHQCCEFNHRAQFTFTLFLSISKMGFYVMKGDYPQTTVWIIQFERDRFILGLYSIQQ